MVPLQAGNIPVPYVACFSIYSRLFHMQNSCQTVQYPMHQSNIPWKSCKAKMTMLLAHSSFPIRLHSIFVKKPCSCKKKLDTWNIPVEKAQSSLFVVPQCSSYFLIMQNFGVFLCCTLHWGERAHIRRARPKFRESKFIGFGKSETMLQQLGKKR